MKLMGIASITSCQFENGNMDDTMMLKYSRFPTFQSIFSLFVSNTLYHIYHTKMDLWIHVKNQIAWWHVLIALLLYYYFLMDFSLLSDLWVDVTNKLLILIYLCVFLYFCNMLTHFFCHYIKLSYNKLTEAVDVCFHKRCNKN